MSDEQNHPNPPQEPSVLDYVKSLFRFGGNAPIHLSDFSDDQVTEQKVVTEEPKISEPTVDTSSSFTPALESGASVLHPSSLEVKTPFPWKSLLALVLALLGQRMFEPPHEPDSSSPTLGIAFYIAAIALAVWAYFADEWRLSPHAPDAERPDPQTYRRVALVSAVIFCVISFSILTDDLFTKLNVTLWVYTIAAFLVAFWVYDPNRPSLWQRIRIFLARDPWQINVTRWGVLLILATGLIFFFRFYRTTNVPPEPFSDHAEKILDVYDVTQGITRIFFPRNTGREGFQMYWTVLISSIFGTGLSFLSLKLGTAILGFLTLPFIYSLGNEIGGKRVGLFAFLFAGIGYWPNVISRVGLRFPLYPLFVAPTLLYLMRGLRTRNRNDILLAGFFLGLGLHGYSPFRLMPFVVIAAFLLYWLHSQSKGARRDLPIWFIMLVLVSVAVFLPLLRYWVDDPQVFSFRALSRLTGSENPITQPIWQVFLSNLWNALKMFNYDDGVIWVHSVVNRPALDNVSAAFFLIGAILLLIRYIRNRHWLDLFLLVSIPLLQMPSILSLSFPSENPALNRAGGALVPAFVVVAIAFDGLLTALGSNKKRSILAWIVTAILVLWSSVQNYDLVFRQYYDSFRSASWNTSEMGAVIKQFGQAYGTTDTAFVVPFPYWVDTRLPGVWAGIPNRDFAMWRDNLGSTVAMPSPKLFIVKANVDAPDQNDQATLDVLKALYPNGQLGLHKSDIAGHDFWIFFVPK